MNWDMVEKMGNVAWRCVVVFFVFDGGWVAGHIGVSRAWALGCVIVALSLIWVLVLAYHVGKYHGTREAQNRGIR